MRIGIIPARYASTRYPGKPLAMIDGKSMIIRVFEQASKAELLDDVIVATDNETIFKHVEKYGGKVVMTKESHVSGTDRCYEAVLNSCKEGLPDIVINIQGDEPFIDPDQIDLVVSAFENPDADIATLIRPISDSTELFNPNAVKVVCDSKGQAMLFSRQAIPYIRGVEQQDWLKKGKFFKHLGIYGYRGHVLEKLAMLPAAELEQLESLEQLRWLWNGFRIQTKVTLHEGISIDTPEDLLKVINKP
ncbi:MAG: 3-deoxy-manno-octulosonate cytidylyltransferase [Sphingobacteriia bacterium]|nr:3-deoxy-manno-octulosonate cytidylyltransferase [Sphingobacteriia bacterium]